MAFTVTATESGASANRGVMMRVEVLTGATEAGGASTGGVAADGTTICRGTITPNGTNSLPVFSGTYDGGTVFPAAGTNTTYYGSAGHGTDGWAYGHGRYTGTVTSGTPVTAGAGSTGGGQDHVNWAVYEVLASGGTTPVVDASTPALATSDTLQTVTTASFTPPNGSVLVALVVAGGTGAGGGITMTITDTSGLGLVWTRRAVSSLTDNYQPAWVYTATVAAAAPAAGPGLLPHTGGEQWRRRHRHRQVLPVAPPLAPVTITATAALAAAGAVAASAGGPYIAGLAGGGTGYFADQYGTPRFYFCDIPWGLPAGAGRWNGGDWQADYDAYLAARAGQGYTVTRVHLFGTVKTGAPDNTGETWDNVPPFTTGTNPSSGFNNTFWTRIDYLVDKALTFNMTVELVAAFTWDWDSGIFANGWTGTQATDYGTSLGNRYKNKPNVTWFFGDDYSGTLDTQFTNILAGIRAAGDTHVVTVENIPESTSRQKMVDASAMAWGVAHAQFNFAYGYEVCYRTVEACYLEASPLPVIYGDGFFYGETGGGNIYDDRNMRYTMWWALSSGARGASTGSVAIWKWDSGSPAAVSTENFFVNQAPVVPAVFAALPNWWLLIPDTSSLLVTSGRGTRGSYSTTLDDTDAYVTASRVPDGSLAVIFFSHAGTIGIDQTKMAPGYTATWVDPANGATSSATPGSSYNATAKGNNSAGMTDWVLILQGTPAAAVPGVAMAPMTGA